MSTKDALRVLFVSALFFLVEYALYSLTGMADALKTQTLAAAIAFKFQWLMVFTLVIGIFAPVSTWLGSRIQKPHATLASWAILVGIVMIGYTSTSFLQASIHTGKPAVSPSTAAVSAEPKPASKVAEMIEYVDSKIEQVDKETLKISLQFKNLSDQEITELDYSFVALQDGAIFYRIKMRDAVYIPPHQSATSALTWKRSSFKDTTLYDTLQKAYSAKGLRVFAKPTRVVRIDGKAVEEPK